MPVAIVRRLDNLKANGTHGADNFCNVPTAWSTQQDSFEFV
jgi:hypothetical protein